MSDTPRTDEARDRCMSCGLNVVVPSDMERLERELTEAIGLLVECKRAFLGYPQETRRAPLDLLRDINRVTAKPVPARRDGHAG